MANTSGTYTNEDGVTINYKADGENVELGEVIIPEGAKPFYTEIHIQMTQNSEIQPVIVIEHHEAPPAASGMPGEVSK